MCADVMYEEASAFADGAAGHRVSETKNSERQEAVRARAGASRLRTGEPAMSTTPSGYVDLDVTSALRSMPLTPMRSARSTPTLKLTQTLRSL